MSAMKALAMREQEDFPLDFFSLNLDDYRMQCDGLSELSIDIPVTDNGLPFNWLADCHSRQTELSPQSATTPETQPTFQNVEETFVDVGCITGSQPPTPGGSSRSTSGYTSPTKTPIFTPSVSPFASHPSSPSPMSNSHAPPSKDIKVKQKIPRHKRKSHIDAEQRRKCKIQNAFDELKNLVPTISSTSPNSGRLSKSAMLNKTVEFCRVLREDSKQLQREANKLKQEIQALTAEITTYQSQLPADGVEAVDVTPASQGRVKCMFEDYVKAKSLANWKFWIFGLVIRPLFTCYDQMVSTSSEPDFQSSVVNWVQEKLALISLRPALLDTLRYISRHTSIMSSPEKFPAEATRAVIDATVSDNLSTDSQSMELS